MTIYEIDGIHVHGNPDGDPEAVGNIYTGATNKEAIENTQKRRIILENCVGENNVIVNTDVEVKQLLDSCSTIMQDARFSI